jgi:hypothetical protein
LIFGSLVSLFGPNLYNRYRLEIAGKQTQGAVTGFDANNHGACKYTFMLNGQRYGGSGNDDCAGAARLDTFVRVTYLPSHPQVWKTDPQRRTYGSARWSRSAYRLSAQSQPRALKAGGARDERADCPPRSSSRQ